MRLTLNVGDHIFDRLNAVLKRETRASRQVALLEHVAEICQASIGANPSRLTRYVECFSGGGSFVEKTPEMLVGIDQHRGGAPLWQPDGQPVRRGH